MTTSERTRARSREHGGLLLITINAVVLTSAAAAALLTVAASQYTEMRSSEESLQAFYIAEAGLNDALDRLSHDRPADIGSENAPVPLSGGSYWVRTADNKDGTHTLVSHALFRGVSKSVQAIASVPGTDPFFDDAAFGDSSTEILDSGQVDSYDSAQSGYLSQAKNKNGPKTFAHANGDVGSNGPVTVGAQTAVFGRVRPGHGNGLALGLGAVVTGSTFPRASRRSLPPVVMPPAILEQPPADLVLAGFQIRFVFPGERRFGRIALSGNAMLFVQTPATLVIDSLQVTDAARVIVIADQGPAFLYVGGSIEVARDAVVQSLAAHADEVLLFVATDNQTGHESSPDGNPAVPLAISGRASFNGILYAPRGVVRIVEQAQVLGAAFAKRLRIRNNGKLHYDEILERLPGLVPGQGTAQSWAAQRQAWTESAFELVFWQRAGRQDPVVSPSAANQPPCPGSGGASSNGFNSSPPANSNAK